MSNLISRRRRKGMTLVEIMIVLSIIGIVSTVLIVGVTGYLDDANVQTTKIQMHNFDQALLTYSAQHHGKFPSSSEGLGAVKNFISNDGELPKDAWDHDFIYSSPGTHGNHPYEIISYGKDGVEGGSDAGADIHSWELSD